MTEPPRVWWEVVVRHRVVSRWSERSLAVQDGTTRPAARIRKVTRVAVNRAERRAKDEIVAACIYTCEDGDGSCSVCTVDENGDAATPADHDAECPVGKLLAVYAARRRAVEERILGPGGKVAR